MSLTVLLGNPNPQMQVERPVIEDRGAGPEVVGTERVSVPAAHLNQSVTRVELWEGVDDPEFVDLSLSTNNDRVLAMIGRELGAGLRRWAVAVAEVEQTLGVHSAGDAPRWVACPEEPDFERALAKHFDCAIGEPTNLLTNAGRDALHAQHLGSGAQPAAFTQLALTANAVAPAAGDTVLTGEITTAGGGLVRATATFAHTAGTNTSTLTKTFTANGTDTLPVVVAKLGVFNGAGAVTMGYETLLNATSTLNLAGDSVTVTETVTAG